MTLLNQTLKLLALRHVRLPRRQAAAKEQRGRLALHAGSAQLGLGCTPQLAQEERCHVRPDVGVWASSVEGRYCNDKQAQAGSLPSKRSL